MVSSQSSGVSVERARQTLCRHIEQLCEQGMSNVRVRVYMSPCETESVWFYGRQKNKWLKLEETVNGADFAREIVEDLERLAASPNSEECQVRRKEFRDRLDFELKFDHEDILAHQGKNLGSYLSGILFRPRHASPRPRREAIRRGTRRPALRSPK